MQSSFKFSELINSKINKLYKNNKIITLISNPLYLSIFIIICILIIFLIIIGYKSTTPTKLFRFTFYNFIIIAFIQLVHNAILKEDAYKKSSKYEDALMINQMDDKINDNNNDENDNLNKIIEPRIQEFSNIKNSQNI